MTEIIRVQDEYYILATSPLADAQTRVLKQGETFAIFDIYGDVRGLARGEQGIYHEGMRHLSRSTLRLRAERPLILGSAVTEDNIVFAVDLTNPDFEIGEAIVPRGTIHLLRSIFLWGGACHQRLRLFNYSTADLDVDLTLEFEADFADIFEVRGFDRSKRGTFTEPAAVDGELVMGYQGLDGVERRTRIIPSAEGTIDGSDIVFKVTVPAQSAHELFVRVVCETGDAPGALPDEYGVAIVHQREAHQRLAGDQTRIVTSNEMFNAWVDRSLADMRMLITATETGPFPFAGVPWYACPFGRDSIITAYEMLWMQPSMAKSVLGYLAAAQATEVDEDRAAEPGKIVHEIRGGELAAIGEVPFGRYYGSVDATPLFVALAGEYLAHTGDLDFVSSIWDNIESALEWCDTFGDADGDGFVEYAGSHKGLIQQGWKDSHDSVFHADGSFADGPIALCEVQGYVYWAKRNAAAIARAVGRRGRAVQLEEQAQTLRERFETSFWVPEMEMYALALDGSKRPCTVKTSNAGHCLLAGIVSEERAKMVATALASDAFFSGWGIRTLATSEARYGPITYHNGSVWPHDNALIAKGLSSYGYKKDVHRIMAALLDASGTLEFHRLPELYCGFPRRAGQGPIEYPLACAPQAWAAASVFLLLQSCLGLSVDAAQRQLVFTRPSLPPFLKELRIEGLRAGSASVDLSFHYHQADDVSVRVLDRSGDVEVVVVK